MFQYDQKRLMLTRLCSVLLGFLVLVGSASEGMGDNLADKNRKQNAKEYFARGELLFENGEFAKAAEAFSLAYENAPHPTVLANIALSFDKAGNIPMAIEAYRNYLAEGIKSKEDIKMHERVLALEKQVGELVIVCSIKSCAVSVDGLLRGDAPLSVLVTPGSHLVEAISEGYPTASVTASVKAGKRRVVELVVNEPAMEMPAPSPGIGEVSPSAVPMTTPMEPEEDDEESSSMVVGIPFWVSLGLTVAAGAATAVCGVRTLQLNKEFNQNNKEDEDIEQMGEKYVLATNILAGVTAAAGATTIGFVIYDVVTSKKNGDDDGKENSDFSLGPGPGLGLGATWNF